MSYILSSFALLLISFSSFAWDFQQFHCSDNLNPYSTERVVISLKPQFEVGTLFLSSDIESGENSGVMKLQVYHQDNMAHYFAAENTIARFIVTIPHPVLGKKSDSALIQLRLEHKNRRKTKITRRHARSSFDQELLCYTRLY